MKRTASLLLIILVSCFSAIAQTGKTRRPALPADITAAEGQDSDSLLKNSAIQTRMKTLLRKKYDSFMESFETLNPVTKKGNFLFASGCMVHACTHLESAIAVDLLNKTIHTAIFRQDEKTSYFNEGGRATPGVIRAWANNLRQINRKAGSSKTERSLATSEVVGAKGETPSIRRLRSLATVRGFIGGESHDGYVIRARKGTVLSLSLSWKQEGDNRASLAVSASPDFYSGKLATFGTESGDGQRWTGRIPSTGDYYIYVVAHPSADYTLKASVR